MIDPADDQQGPDWALVMPFVCCLSDGGTLDDHAFVEGVKYGETLHLIRSQHPARWQGYVHPEMVKQYDLAAMHYGYTMTAEPWEEAPDEHVLVTLTKIGRIGAEDD